MLSLLILALQNRSGNRNHIEPEAPFWSNSSVNVRDVSSPSDMHSAAMIRKLSAGEEQRELARWRIFRKGVKPVLWLLVRVLYFGPLLNAEETGNAPEKFSG